MATGIGGGGRDGGQAGPGGQRCRLPPRGCLQPAGDGLFRLGNRAGGKAASALRKNRRRRLPDGALWISDSHGIAFLVRDRRALDRRSRRVLERFL